MRKNLVKILGIGLPFIGATCMILYALTGGGWKFILHGIANFFLIGGASFVGGGLLGFLFGIPKIIQSNNSVNTYKANTNLEQISDWLTKILLGVGLTQIDEITAWIGQVSNYAAQDMTMIGDESAFIASLIVYFIVCGFLDGYLATRIILPRVFERADNFEKKEEDNDNPPKDG